MLSSMKSPSPLLLLLVLLPPLAGAQLPPPGAGDGNPYPYARFSPTMAIIIVVLIAALFLMGFFSIYIRHCSDPSTSGATARRVLSTRRRAAAAPGLDQSVLETFPIFTYSDVKSHKIGKGALECAVCLNEFEDDETLRLIPKCDHVFHPECIDAWLESHVTCPVCRTNLVPQPGDAPTPEPVQAPEPPENNTIERNRSRTGEVVIEIDENRKRTEPVDPVEYPNRAPRSWSVRTARVFGLNKFRSHSTGHSLVQPGENLDRFTLRLPKEMMERAVLNRTASCAVTLPRERSSRRGIRTGDGSSRGGRFFQRIERSDQEGKSDRWIFFSRGLSTRSTKVVADAGESSGGSGRPVKLPSFNCLEPKTTDEVGLISEDRSKSPV